MAKRDENFRRGGERPELTTSDDIGDEHGEPREYPTEEREKIFSRPYDEWSGPGYGFYAGEGYHREFVDPYGLSNEPESGSGGQGFQVVRIPRGRFTGRGPKNYTRSDERIGEDVNEILREHGEIDASDMSIQISGGEVTLEGNVDDRRAKRLAEDLAQSVRGVRDVQNRLRIAERIEHTDADVQGAASHSGTGFLTENIEVPRDRSR
jgi:hypothetical protein